MPILSKRVQRVIEGKIDARFFNYVVNISERFGYIFVSVPKVASSSVLAFLQSAENEALARKMSGVHSRGESPLRSLSSYDEAEQDALLFSGKHRAISFVRNPLDRLLSAYLSKIDQPFRTWRVDPAFPNIRPPKASVLAVIHGKDILEITDLKPVVSFEEFIDVVSAQSVLEMDIHWKPQTAILSNDEINYDFIGYLEKSATDFKKLATYVGNTSVLPKITTNRTNSSDKHDRYYSNQLKKKVFEIFEKDYDVLFDSHTNKQVQEKSLVSGSNCTRRHLKIRDCALQQGQSRSSSAVYMRIHEQRRATLNAVAACKSNFEIASSLYD